jgi:hypothetical protein
LGDDTRELLSLEEIDLLSGEGLDYIGREVWQPQVMVYEAGERYLSGCFTVEEVCESCRHPEQVRALPFTRASALGVRGWIALGVAGGAEQAYYLFLLLWDEMG